VKRIEDDISRIARIQQDSLHQFFRKIGMGFDFSCPVFALDLPNVLRVMANPAELVPAGVPDGKKNVVIAGYVFPARKYPKLVFPDQVVYCRQSCSIQAAMTSFSPFQPERTYILPLPAAFCDACSIY